MSKSIQYKERQPLDGMQQALLESIDDPACYLDADGEPQLSNAQFKTLLLTAPAPPSVLERLCEPISETIRTGEPYRPNASQDLLRLRVGETIRTFQPFIQPVIAGGETITGATLLLKDVSEFDLLGQVKSDLIATFNHEINTPATSIRMAIQLLLEQQVGSINRGQFELLKLAEQDVDRMLRTLRNLLDLNRFNSGAYHLHLEWETPAKLVSLAAKNAAPLARKRDQTIAIDIPADLPPIRVDRERIVHSLSNIINNAVKYSDAGEEIRITAEASGADLKISVRDSGPGIPSEYTTRIFDRYVTIPKRERNGPGLGLSVAREFIEAHGGKLGVVSDGTLGSEFYVVLPIKSDEENIIE